MAKIVINALSARQGGGQTYVRNFLARLDNSHNYLVLVGPYNRPIFERAITGKGNIQFVDCGKIQTNPLLRLLWERFILSSLLKKWKPDLYFAAGGGTITKVSKGTVSATIIRNMLPFDKNERSRFPFFSLDRLKLTLLRHIAIYALKRCDKAIFISEYSRKVVAQLVPEINKKAKVIYHGVDEHFIAPPSFDFDFSSLGVKRGMFYLYVSIFNHYKAQAELVREWKVLSQNNFPYPLVLTGFMQPRYTEYVRNIISETGQSKNVIISGPVPYEKLPAYYNGARALVFASSCECCPNILLEMMATGKPLFCSDFPPMPEIGGENLIYFHPYTEGDLAKKIEIAESDFNNLRICSERNRTRARNFSWDKTVSESIRFLMENTTN